MNKYMVLTDLTSTYEGIEIMNYNNLEECKEYFNKERKRGYDCAMIKYEVIENFEESEI